MTTTRWKVDGQANHLDLKVLDEKDNHIISISKVLPYAQADALAAQIVRDHNEAQAMREAIQDVLEDASRYPLLQATENKLRAALRGGKEPR